jgi:predicted glycosyltransferase
MRADGHEVEVTARDFAQTLELCRRFGIAHTAVGRHRGGRLAGKALGLASRSLALTHWAYKRRFDLAIGHGSNDVSVAAKLLRVPSATSFDYEWATAQHQINCRLARAVVVPDAIPPERLERYGARGKIHAYPGLKEEYYLADFEPDPAVLEELGLDRARPLVVVRTPPDVSLYHRFENPLFRRVLDRLAGSEAQTVVLPRTPAQRAELAGQRSFAVPEHAIDAQSLVAYADLVISAGGTMNREAVALGTPVFTTFEGRLGAVDEALLREGRLRKLDDPGQIEIGRRPANGGLRIRRNPRELVKMLLAAREP